MNNNYAHNLALRLALLLCNPAVRCSVPEKGHVQGKQGSYEAFSFTERNKSAKASDTFTRLYNFYHKTGSGLNIDS